MPQSTLQERLADAKTEEARLRAETDQKRDAMNAAAATVQTLAQEIAALHTALAAARKLRVELDTEARAAARQKGA